MELSSLQTSNHPAGCPHGRRQFLQQSACASALAWLAGRGVSGVAEAEDEVPRGRLAAVEARYYEQREHGSIECHLEPRQCHIGKGERGFCGVRENREGKYYSLTYGRPCVVRVAPIEENFMHVLPGAKALNVGTAGCNLQCVFCNTYHISQARPEDTHNQSLTPEQLVERAKSEGCQVICFTDNDPVVCFEYMLDTAQVARKAGLKTTCHTAAQLHPEPARDMAQHLDAVTVDLKAHTNKRYSALTAVELDPILLALKTLCETDTFVEVASPLIPKVNEPEEFGKSIAAHIVERGGPLVPWQLMRYFPSYQVIEKTIATPLSMMRETKEIGHAAGLKHIYLCAVRTADGQDIKCPKCGETCVTRDFEGARCLWKKPGTCSKCNTKIAGVWS